MALNTVNPVGSSAGNQVANISQQDFLKILLTQLNNQDPLKPMDNTAFVAQLAQFAQLAQSQEISSNLNQLLAVQVATESISLLGHNVGIIYGSGIVSGQVIDVSVSGNAPQLTIKPASGPNVTDVALNRVIDIK